MRFQAGDSFGKYTLIRLLGEGGMGVVYYARDTLLVRDVALKIMAAQLAEDEEFRRRFSLEARAISLLKHPHIVGIHDHNEVEGHLYIAMDYIEGGSLSEVFRRLRQASKRLPISDALQIIAQIAAALDYAHTQKIVHRDIKPANVMLARANEENVAIPHAVVTDFGLAKLIEIGQQSHTGRPIGTPAYMSPEQCQALPLDGRTDIYAVGIMMFQLLTGQLPYQVSTITEALQQHVHAPIPDPRNINEHISPSLATIIRRALSKDPDDRYQSADLLALDVRQELNKYVNKGGNSDNKETALVTILDQIKDYEESTRIGLQAIRQVTPAPYPQLLVVHRNEPGNLQVFPLQRRRIRIGRGKSCDIQLPDSVVSNEHAILDTEDGQSWRITDVSRNGIRLFGERLLSGMPEPWPENEPAGIGPFSLVWIPGTEILRPFEPETRLPAATAVIEGQVTNITRMQTSFGEVTLQPATLKLAPGQYGTVQVQVLNVSRTIQQLRPKIEGLPEDWIHIQLPTDRETFELMDRGGKVTFPISIRLPEARQTRAGERSFKLNLHNQDGELSYAISGLLIITPVVDIRPDTFPTHVTNQGRIRVKTQNRGNIPTTVIISAVPSELGLLIEPSSQRVVVPVGEDVSSEFQVSAKRPKWGMDRRYGYAFEFDVQDQDVPRQSGQLEAKARLPVWMLSLLLFGCLLLSVVSAFAYVQYQNLVSQTATAEALQILSATENQIALANETAESLSLTRSAETATAAAQATANALATADRLTTQEAENIIATAHSDIDEDGLPYADEIRLGTDPNDPDSDNDGLKDGEEVNLGLPPDDPDADKDGIPDGLDMDPFNLTPTPTSTPTPSHTPTWTPTVTPSHTPTWTPTAEETFPEIAFGQITFETDGADDWHEVKFDEPFSSPPIVVVGPSSFNGDDPLTVRVTDVTTEGFKVQLDEWDLKNGNGHNGGHNEETLSYLALLPGEHEFGVLTAVAGKVNITHEWESVSFDDALFNSDIVVLAQVASYNGSDAATTRLRSVTAGGFEIRLQEEKASEGTHVEETVHYIAIEANASTVRLGPTNAQQIKACTFDRVTDQWSSIDWDEQFDEFVFLADIQTFNGSDPVTLRYRNLNGNGVDIRMQEEISDGNLGDFTHVKEVVGWVIIGQVSQSLLTGC